MKKKILIITMILLIVSSASVFAIGVGGAFSFSPFGDSIYYGGALSLKLDNWPLLGISAAAQNGDFHLGLTADWWFVNQNLTGPLNFYAGIGGYGALTMGNNVTGNLGLRIPFGLNIFVINPLELFLELAPAAGFGFGNGSFNFPSWSMQTAIGFRFWF